MRRRFVYRPNPEGGVDCIEVTPDYQSTAERMPVFTDRHLEGQRASDGTDIGSRGKRKEWMQRNGLADAADFTETWARAEAQRADFYEGRHDTKARREDVARAVYQLKQQGGRRSGTPRR